MAFWNRKQLYATLGWDNYYDKSFFGDEDHVAFGASDDILYEKTLPKLMEMQEQGKPFYAQIISMSAHHPFDLPESKMTLNLPENLNDTLMGRYLQSQHYADQAIGKFIADLKSSGLWDNSIVMFYGDHQGLPIYSLSKNERNAMEGLIGHEYNTRICSIFPLSCMLRE